MANIPLFVENRANKDNIHYLHEDLKPILKETYGIIVYQEQIMMIATKMAGFSMAKADIMRKAMSKKKENELNSLATDFINGCIKNGYSKSLAEEVYNLILKFANYGFNKSHSIAYAKIAYELAYLKANYPLYFYKALLNGVIGSETKTYEYILECQKVNVQFRGFSINRSSDVYIIDKDAILMPLSIIKDVGTVALNNIINDRYINGPYLSYEDAVCRLINMSVNKNIIEKLIMAGAFDEFNYSRMTMKENLDQNKKQNIMIISKVQILNMNQNTNMIMCLVSNPNNFSKIKIQHIIFCSVEYFHTIIWITNVINVPNCLFLAVIFFHFVVHKQRYIIHAHYHTNIKYFFYIIL